MGYNNCAWCQNQQGIEAKDVKCKIGHPLAFSAISGIRLYTLVPRETCTEKVISLEDSLKIEFLNIKDLDVFDLCDHEIHDEMCAYIEQKKAEC